jgi:hypothetical protein
MDSGPSDANLEDAPSIVDMSQTFRSIIDPRGDVPVWVPGSVYQPLLLRSQMKDTGIIHAGPGAMDEQEERFVIDLLLHLGGDGAAVGNLGEPLLWGQKTLWLKRNIENQPTSLRFRLEDSNWFYPDFVLWIVDPAARVQTVGFVDPKGLVVGTGGGWEDYKVLCTAYFPHVLEAKLGASLITGGDKDDAWTMRIRGVLVSTSDYDTLSAQRKFYVNDKDMHLVPPSRDDFRRARILFMDEERNYISDMLNLLIIDSEIDRLLREAALFATHGETSVHDLRCRSLLSARWKPEIYTESNFASNLICDALRLNESRIPPENY